MEEYAGKWQDHEIEALRIGIAEGLTDRELTARIPRTFFAIQRKRIQLRFLNEPGRPRASDWLSDELEALKSGVAEGLNDSDIASQIGRSRLAVKGKRLELGLKTKRWSRFSEADDQVLREKTLAGYSSAYIQKEFLPHLTIGSICGRRHRLNLKSGLRHGTNRQLQHRTLWTEVARKVSRPKSSKSKTRVAPTDPFKLRVANVEPLKIPFVEHKEFQCRWICDERGDDGLALFCGHGVWGETPYCGAHASIAYRWGYRNGVGR